jgi:hypothetical protein
VSQDEPFFARRRYAVAVLGDLAVGTAHADQQRPDQQQPVGRGRLGQLDYTRCLGTAGD